MEIDKKNYCVILAGGRGRRLWPCSRDQFPKQFIDFFGTGRTQLQTTFDRFAKVIPVENILICTCREFLPLVLEQLPGVDEHNILVEPVNRNTGASVAWANMRIKRVTPDANIIIAPSDHMVMNDDLFLRSLETGISYVQENNVLLVMGVKPTRPEPGYGYIQMGDLSCKPDVYRVQSFTEKPERQFAELFINDGSFLWNTGIFLFSADALLENVYQLVPEYQQEIPQMMADAEKGEPKFLPEFFSVLPRLSIDLSIMEKSRNVYVYESHFGWADLGTWSTLDAHSAQTEEPDAFLPREDAEGNLLLDTRAMLSHSHDNVIRLPKGRTAVIDGLKGYVVVEEGDVLMICPKENTAVMRRMMTEAQTQLGIE